MITFDMDEGDFMKDGEMLPVKFMDWKKLLGMDICLDGHDENDQQWIAAILIVENQSIRSERKQLERSKERNYWNEWSIKNSFVTRL